ncbi:MAG: tail-specific protease [Porticoccaceae bacterium]|nr:tail-specific protease [Porticoccaceae bacterium]|tara:strand:- start:6627 stop:8798 length:2172 start_codon:yes stop_codon:yes gene_type:complete
MRQVFRPLSSLLLFLSTLIFSLSVVASESIETEDGQSSLYREIFERLASRHYRSQEIDDALSDRYLDEYINTLDSGKNYFLQSDIDEFEKWRSKLDDLSKRGDIKPGFIMFNRVRDRAMTQLEKNITLLEDENYVFDFETSDSIMFDPELRSWFKTQQEASKFWEKRLVDSMIRLLLNEKDEADARELLIKRYRNQIKQFEQRDSQDVLQLYANALASLYDPHTSYFSPRTNENFQINMSLSLEGIGAELSTEDDYTKINRIVPGGPADLHGVLKAEDKIVGVGQAEEDIVDVIGWRIDDVVALIRGAKDTTVRLQFIPSKGDSSNTKTITIVRDKVKLENKSAQSKILDVVHEGQTYKLGVIDIPAFYMDFEAYRARDPNYKSTTRDVYKLVEELKDADVDGIVVDLRSNGGGSLYEATSLTDLFIDYGPVVQIRDSDMRVQRNQRAYRRAAYNGPLLVMINRLSASASEIFAGALQDYGRALVVGSQSFGKGTVQDITALSSGQLKMTVSKFYRVSGDSTQHRGILPDISFPSLHDLDEVGESHQDNALPWDSIHRVPHQTKDELKGFIGPLTESHLERRKEDPDFASLIERIELSDSWAQEKSLSLNLEERRIRSESWDLGLFEIENRRLIAKGEVPFDTLEAWRLSDEVDEENDTELPEEQAQLQDQAEKEGAEEEEENIPETDPLLFEAGKILGQQIYIESTRRMQQVAQIESEQERD